MLCTDQGILSQAVAGGLVATAPQGCAGPAAIGVQTNGAFAAHVWVEVGGQPVNDAPDVAERFAPFDGSLSTRLVS